MDFLRDPAWQSVGAIAAILAVGAAIVLYLIQRNIKRLAYEVVSDVPVFSVEEAVRDKIQVLYNGKPINDARLVVLRIWNAGNADILSSDYERPIKFDFGQSAEVLDATIQDTLPESLKEQTSVQITAGCVTLSPLLLNSRDKITLRVLLSNHKEELKVSARIAGIKEISLSKYEGDSLANW